MPVDPESDIQFEIGHILLIDIVGYSKLLINAQREQLQTLNEIVRNTGQSRAADANGMVVRIPTGDGMALIFRDSLESPARCAFEIAQALRSRPEIRVRMGIHSGPVSDVRDVNDRDNVAGAGIDLAQRVMDCGDAGHILLSKRVADDLAPYPRWNPYLHELGECEVKHGVKLSLVNLYTDEIGNPQLPEKLKKAQEKQASAMASARRSMIARRKKLIIGAATFVVAALAIVSLFFFRHGARPSLISEKSIAVLPFVNMSGNAANNDFSDGITEEILNALAQISGLKVAARTSAFQFKGKNVDLRQVGEALAVAYVLEGSVQRAGDDVRVTAQLIDARSGYHLWSEKYDRKLTNIFAMEDEISKAIVAQMQLTLSGNQEKPLVKTATADPQAHEFYLKGLARVTERGPALNSAVEFFKQAIALDPNYAAAWAGLGQAYELLPWYKLAPWQTSLAQAQEAAQQALSLDPQLAEAHTALANVLRDRFDFAGATKQYQAALERNPGSVETLNQYAQMLLRMGRFEQAAKQERMAVALDPLAPNPRYILGMILASLHRYDEAIAEEKASIAWSPNYAYARFDLACLYLDVSNYAEAEKEARAAAAQVGEDPEVIATLIHAVANPAQRASALKLVTEGKVGRYDLRGVTDGFWYTKLGAYKEALESLKQWLATTQEGQLFADTQILWKPAFDPIRGDERFQKIMKSLGLPSAPVHPEHTP